MTSSTKRRLAVLALALGLIAAAPYVFHFIADRSFNVRYGRSPWELAVTGFTNESHTAREVELRFGSVVMAFQTVEAKSMFLCVSFFLSREGRYIDVPHESVTLRVACAVALAVTWLIVIGIRALLRRWIDPKL